MTSKLADILWISARRILRKRTRYLGPATALIIGTAGLIVVITLRGDIKRKANENLDLLGGATILELSYEDKPWDFPWSQEPRFFYGDIIRAVERLPGVKVVSALARKQSPAAVGWGPRLGRFTLVAVDHHFWRLHSFKAASGGFFGKEAVEYGEAVCVIGAEVARYVFDRVAVAGRSLLVDGQPYRIAGVLDGFRVGEGTRFVFVPLTTALSRVADMTLPGQLYIRCHSWTDVEAVAEALPATVGQYVYTDRLRVSALWDNLYRTREVAFWLEIFANVCVIATLALGGIGVWNVQMAAVRARTREIGIKKAVGAEDLDILVQILAESVSVCLGSLLLGILLSAAATRVISHLLDSPFPFALFLRAAGWSVLFSLLLGILAGLLPALKASRMEVVRALRYD